MKKNIGENNQQFEGVKKLPVSIILVRGGHTFEMLALVDRLERFIEPVYLVLKDNKLAKEQIRISGKVYTITPAFESIKTKKFLKNFFLFFKSFGESLKILKESKVCAVISCGSGSAIASIIAAKMLRKKVIYIESACRIKSRSICGNIAYKFLADLFIIQWEEQRKIYKKAIYAGRAF